MNIKKYIDWLILVILAFICIFVIMLLYLFLKGVI